MIDGVAYSFIHLRSFDMELATPARGDLPEFKIKVRVVFDCHVVTEKAEYVDGDPAFWRDTGGGGRKFDPVRYRYSLGLPNLISDLPSGKVKCYVGKKNNYMVWESGEDKAHYQAFFDIYMPAGQAANAGAVPLLILYVQSAYLKDEPFARQRERSKALGQICAEVVGVMQRKPKGPRTAMRK